MGRLGEVMFPLSTTCTPFSRAEGLIECNSCVLQLQAKNLEPLATKMIFRIY
jgi:hypothetical protein